VSEQLAFKQALDHRGTVQHHKPAAGNGAEIMQGPRGEFLAGSRLPGDQYTPVVRCNATNAGERFPHGGAPSDHALKLRFSQEVVVERGGPLPAAGVFNQPGYPLPKRGNRDRLVQIIRCAFLNRLHGGFAGVMRGHQNDIDRRVEFNHALHHFHPADTRHNQIGQDNIRVFAEHRVQTLFRILGRGNLQTFAGERRREQFQTARVVINDDHPDVWFDIHERIRSACGNILADGDL
jgi:hypothetical protein